MLLGSSHNEAVCLQVQAGPRRCLELMNWRKASVYKNRSGKLEKSEVRNEGFTNRELSR